MLILALDTTGDWGGAAVFRDDECLGVSAQRGFINYSVSLFQAVDDALEKAGLRLNEIDLFAAANGPGSFTGIRVGLAAAQGWAHAFGKPARGVSAFEAAAEEAQAPTPFTLSVLDARRGEFYAGLVRRVASAPPLDAESAPGAAAVETASRWMEQGEGVILKPDRILPFVQSRIPPGDGCTLTARENDPQACALAKSLTVSLPWKPVSGFLSGAVARAAWYALRDEGRSPLPQDLSAYYVRRPDAEINWKP
ncbi:MAG: tRNA (adenosine(37)-N6)-threonylcarbamoyltransferase complex dimerization subunit type 1 TsaB [Terriglobia bacterium]